MEEFERASVVGIQRWPQRKGKWTAEEELYANFIIACFNEGVLPIEAGTTLRGYLSNKLNCDPMRITKKYSGASCIGKQIFAPCDFTGPRVMSRDVVDRKMAKLKSLEMVFMNRLSIGERPALIRSINQSRSINESYGMGHGHGSGDPLKTLGGSNKGSSNSLIGIGAHAGHEPPRNQDRLAVPQDNGHRPRRVSSMPDLTRATAKGSNRPTGNEWIMHNDSSNAARSFPEHRSKSMASLNFFDNFDTRAAGELLLKVSEKMHQSMKDLSTAAESLKESPMAVMQGEVEPQMEDEFIAGGLCMDDSDDIVTAVSTTCSHHGTTGSPQNNSMNAPTEVKSHIGLGSTFTTVFSPVASRAVEGPDTNITSISSSDRDYAESSASMATRAVSSKRAIDAEADELDDEGGLQAMKRNKSMDRFLDGLY